MQELVFEDRIDSSILSMYRPEDFTSYSIWNGLRTMGSSSTQLNCCKYGWARASSAVSLREGSNTSSFSRRSKAETAKAKYS